MILLKWRLEICKAYLELIQIVRSKYPGALIFCILASVCQVVGVPQKGWKIHVKIHGKIPMKNG